MQVSQFVLSGAIILADFRVSATERIRKYFTRFESHFASPIKSCATYLKQGNFTRRNPIQSRKQIVSDASFLLTMKRLLQLPERIVRTIMQVRLLHLLKYMQLTCKRCCSFPFFQPNPAFSSADSLPLTRLLQVSGTCQISAFYGMKASRGDQQQMWLQAILLSSEHVPSLLSILYFGRTTVLLKIRTGLCSPHCSKS